MPPGAGKEMTESKWSPSSCSSCMSHCPKRSACLNKGITHQVYKYCRRRRDVFSPLSFSLFYLFSSSFRLLLLKHYIAMRERERAEVGRKLKGWKKKAPEGILAWPGYSSERASERTTDQCRAILASLPHFNFPVATAIQWLHYAMLRYS